MGRQIKIKEDEFIKLKEDVKFLKEINKVYVENHVSLKWKYDKSKSNLKKIPFWIKKLYNALNLKQNNMDTRVISKKKYKQVIKDNENLKSLDNHKETRVRRTERIKKIFNIKYIKIKTFRYADKVATTNVYETYKISKIYYIFNTEVSRVTTLFDV